MDRANAAPCRRNDYVLRRMGRAGRWSVSPSEYCKSGVQCGGLIEAFTWAAHTIGASCALLTNVCHVQRHWSAYKGTSIRVGPSPSNPARNAFPNASSELTRVPGTPMPFDICTQSRSGRPIENISEARVPG